ncbi:hypothetical protein AU626_22085 [Salmonella enterica subsp. enterica serovar Sekondi]|uniref:P-loop ATPase, Sll1717 family n=1 Tax=Enterobacteriaceae TaxID=543 RepID=UPI000957FCB6|nr:MULTISPECIES: hypothetical protein [Enterobacteriaceae]EAC1011536.1 hypothetical protein [Salmonella enterica subsp. enterica serovar Jangwani]EAY0929733.1 hypothetical protein [Salmonella enterica]ECE1088832.1 hypothetical protein [Salmonella enterica subsp. diarizonae]ECF3415720.1 hypothetical protein [Salmonella enterica subsp. enterica serovar Linton]ECN4755351.1 hypothetical protein [Salmonella enterica subsp. enterica serovar Heidelberg]ECY3517838.1 hypothetical protein [Salmonella e
MHKFKDINFEYTDAQEERLHAPNLINEAFVDINKITDSIFKPNKYIVYGPKGAGKSALASKLMFTAQEQWDFFCEIDDLEEFEFSLLKRTSGVGGEKIGGVVIVWKLLLYIRVLSLYGEDELISDSSSNLNGLITDLKKYGFLSTQSLVEVVQETSRKGLYAKFSNLFGALGLQGNIDRASEQKVKDPAGLVNAIEKALVELGEVKNKHYLIIDGLDYLLRNGKDYSQYLVDLVAAVRQVNNFFSSMRNDSKVVILFRDEILDILPDPNLTKRTTDNGIALNWYDKEGKQFDSYLLKVIENRAKLAGYTEGIKELWKMWFPDKIGKKDSILFILDNSRYLPRDLISFFRSLQSLEKSPPFSVQDIYSATSSYSEWFVSELSDALVGLVNEEIRKSIPEILSDIGPRFTAKEFYEALKEYDVTMEIADSILDVLFNTSWIGNVWDKFGSPRYAWRHRREKAVMNPKKGCLVHNGLLKSLNLT